MIIKTESERSLCTPLPERLRVTGLLRFCSFRLLRRRAQEWRLVVDDADLRAALQHAIHMQPPRLLLRVEDTGDVAQRRARAVSPEVSSAASPCGKPSVSRDGELSGEPCAAGPAANQTGK